MSVVYYCPRCGNTIVYGIIEIFGSSFEEHEKVTKTVKGKINKGEISLDEQKICFFCEEMERRRDSKKLEKGKQNLIYYCKNCFDWRINDVWQGFTFQQKENLRLAFLENILFLDGEAIDECPRCVEINAFVRERTKNVYDDSYKPFERRQNEAELD